MLGVRLADLDVAAMKRIVDLRIAEGAMLDFKREFRTGNNNSLEFAKDICAFANSQGGLLLFGVSESNGRAQELAPFESPRGEIRDRIAQVLSSYTRPAPAFDASLISSGDDGKVFVAVAVPQSRSAPHAIIRADKGDPWLQFPIRYESTTRFMDEAEIASRYVQRVRTTDEQTNRLRSLIDAERSPASEIVLGLSLVPNSPGRIEIDAKAADRLFSWVKEQLETADRNFGISLRLKVREKSFRPGAIRVQLDRGHLDFFDDGSMSAEIDLEPHASPGLRRVASRPAGIQDETLVAGIACLLNFGGRYAVHGSGAQGGALVGLRLDATGSDGAQRHLGLLAAASSSVRSQRRMVGHSSSGVAVEAEVIVEELAGEAQRLLAATHRIGSAAMQHFGVASPPMITRNGKLRLEHFSEESSEQVEKWAGLSDVVCL